MATMYWQTLGYLPNPRIANLVRAARANLAQKPFAFIKSIDKKRQIIQLGLAIYQKMTEPVLSDIPHIESWLLETDGEDIVGKSRQKHLEEVEVGQLLSLQLNPPYEQITVCPLEGDELGKLNHPLQGQNLVYRPEKPRKLKTRQPLKQATAPVAFFV